MPHVPTVSGTQMAMTITHSAASFEEGVPLYVDAATVNRCTPMGTLVEALRHAFKNRAQSPGRQAFDLPDGATLLIMPAWQRGMHCGVKIVTVQPDARPTIQSTYLLMDARTGKLRAVMDGTMLTPRRTAAASALACEYLAREDASVLLVIGTGTLVPHLVEAHSTVRPIERVMIWGRDPMKAERVVDLLVKSGIAASTVIDLDQAIPKADIISAATSSRRPLLHGALLAPGTHVDLVGSFKPDMTEADPLTFARARTFVDAYDAALEEAGDLLQAMEAGRIRRDDILGDLHALCSGRIPGRTANDDITLFKSVGVSMEDLAAAELVFNSCCDG